MYKRQIIYSDKGHVCITRGEHEFMLEQGELVFLRPNLYHNICSDGKHAANVFIISFDTNSSAMRYFEDKVIKIPDGLKGLISQIIAEGKSAFILPMPDPKLRELIPKEDSMIGAQQLVRLNLEQFLILLLRHEQQTKINNQLFTSKSKFDNHIACLLYTSSTKAPHSRCSCHGGNKAVVCPGRPSLSFSKKF